MANSALPVIGPSLPRLPSGVAQLVDFNDAQGVRLTSELHGQYTNQTLAGNLWHAQSVVGGVSIPAPNTVNAVCCIWNKAGSGVAVVITRIGISYVSGTTAPGGIFLSQQATPGLSAAATGAAITAFTHVDPLCGLVTYPYGALAGKVGFAPATTTFATALTQGIFCDLSYGAITASVTNGPQVSGADMQGSIIIPPGVAVAPVAIVLTTALYNVKFSFYLVPTATPNG
jgi:hypothetical protein